MLNIMKKIFLAVVAIFFTVPILYVTPSYAQQATTVEIIKVSDYLALKGVDPADVAKILATRITPSDYIAWYSDTKELVEVNNKVKVKGEDGKLIEIDAKEKYYIVMSDLGPTLTAKYKKGEAVEYPINFNEYKPGKGLFLIPDVKEIPPPKPPAAITPPVQSPPARSVTVPAIVKGELEDVYKSRDGKKYVIKYSVPDPASPGKMIVKHISVPAAPMLMGFEELSDVDSNSPVYFKLERDGENDRKHERRKERPEYEKSDSEHPRENEIIGITIINPDPAIKLKPLVVGGEVVPHMLRQEIYAVDEIRGVITYPKLPNLDARLINGLIQPPAAPTEAPKAEKPFIPDNKKDNEAPKNWWDNIFRKKPAADPALIPPEAAAAATADPKLPRGRQPRKSPVAPPVATPVKSATEDVPGVSTSPAPKGVALDDLDFWESVMAPMTLSPEDIKAGYKGSREEGFSVKVLKDAKDKITGYEVGVSFCPDGGLACGPAKKATGASFEEAKKNAMDAAKAAYNTQFPASKNQLMTPGSMRKIR